ncbi:peptidase [Mangrovihabitans endophyticus]|uniref:Peptidase n=1 Tax=Mangrovihabitans endophyticus TaxID=1751298 RepID=A0A8J3FRK1_9ACTN|nr:peptidase [Mangrovihabitans endophyticus]
MLFLRTRGPEDPVRCLWAYDTTTGREELLADPRAFDAPPAGTDDVDRVRRERSRDHSAGISAFVTDADARRAAFVLSGHLFLLADGFTRLGAAAPASDPRFSPDGGRIAYVSAGALRVIGADGAGDRAVAEPDGPDVTWGLAEHEAAESMSRDRGFWWAPDGDRLAVARVDNAGVPTWHLTDPARPDAVPRTLRYPYAGTPNARVSLFIAGPDGRVEADLRAAEYLVDVLWDDTGLFAVTQDRPQRTMRLLAVDPESGASSVLREDTDHAWTTIVPGFPAHTADGALLWTVDDGDTRRLTVDGEPVTPPGLEVFRLLGVDGGTALIAASDEPTQTHLWTWNAADGLVRQTTEPGMHGGILRGGTLVVTSSTLDGSAVAVRPSGGGGTGTLHDDSAAPDVSPVVRLIRAGRSELPTAVLFPAGHNPGSGPLPVLLDPYAGTAVRRVVASRAAYHVSQWFADQGFAVVIADGRGVPGRGPRWERTVHRDRADAVLADQVEALHAVAERHPEMDLGRVAIRGWSAGGTLAALAVLRRPDVFHAAAAGAPVTIARLYSSHWQERYLGDPDEDPQTYERNTLIADAPNLRRPLLLIHGMLDDNVLPVHTMRLSQALLEAGRPHTVLPLHDASHMIARPETAEAVLTYEARFLREALGL